MRLVSEGRAARPSFKLSFLSITPIIPKSGVLIERAVEEIAQAPALVTSGTIQKAINF